MYVKSLVFFELATSHTISTFMACRLKNHQGWHSELHRCPSVEVFSGSCRSWRRCEWVCTSLVDLDGFLRMFRMFEAYTHSYEFPFWSKNSYLECYCICTVGDCLWMWNRQQRVLYIKYVGELGTGNLDMHDTPTCHPNTRWSTKHASCCGQIWDWKVDWCPRSIHP